MEAHLRMCMRALDGMVTGVGVHNERLREGQQATRIEGPVVGAAMAALYTARAYLAQDPPPLQQNPYEEPDTPLPAGKPLLVTLGFVREDGYTYSWSHWYVYCSVWVLLLTHLARAVWIHLGHAMPLVTLESLSISVMVGLALAEPMYEADRKVNGLPAEC